MTEIWKPAFGFEEYYEVSSLGRVRRIKRSRGTRIGKVLRPNPAGLYNAVSLSVKQKIKTIDTHVLVCIAFHGPKPSPKHEVNHKDGDKKNDCFQNLEWATRSEQEKHKYRVLGCPPVKGMLGKHQTNKARALIREFQLNKVVSEETRLKQSIAAKTRWKRVKNG